MGTRQVDQVMPDGALVTDYDMILSLREKDGILLAALPGSTVENYAGKRLIRYEDQVILKRQVTHLGGYWPAFKKRIQIPPYWLDIERQARLDRLQARFVGIYHYGGSTIFVDFDPSGYTERSGNNSAAHTSTNDLYQAITLGIFSRVDTNGNRLTSIRSDLYAAYMRGDLGAHSSHLSVFKQFNREFLSQGRIDALGAIQEMHATDWPDVYQAEWPGFYLEYRFAKFLRRRALMHRVEFQKIKGRGQYDYDLVFKNRNSIDFFGDLKASNSETHVSPGNDAADIRRCIAEYGRFWYVIYEHETWHARSNGDLATVAWNEWKRSVGYKRGKPFNALSYSTKFKEAVDFQHMMILEVNDANFEVVLGEFRQGKQPDGSNRALKVMINKRNIDNFLIYSTSMH